MFINSRSLNAKIDWALRNIALDVPRSGRQNMVQYNTIKAWHILIRNFNLMNFHHKNLFTTYLAIVYSFHIWKMFLKGDIRQKSGFV